MDEEVEEVKGVGWMGGGEIAEIDAVRGCGPSPDDCSLGCADARAHLD